MTDRKIVLDVETTGLSPKHGDRLVEIGCVELINYIPTGKTYYTYLNPEREVCKSAFDVHGLSLEFLEDKPKFAEICNDFLEFIGDSKLVIHNAQFDIKFINAELSLVEKPLIPMERAIDTLKIARDRFKDEKNNLDALCKRFGISLTSRDDRHGALIDCELLAKVYLELFPTEKLEQEISTDTKKIAKKIIAGEKLIAELNERIKKGKEYITNKKEQMIKILDGTGETVCHENYEITCSSPKGSVEITGEVPEKFCKVKEVSTHDKTAIKKALEAGEKLDFATIGFNVKLNIKEVKDGV